MVKFSFAMKKSKLILGIETSCDETAVAVLRIDDISNFQGKILANIVSSQENLHAKYGGVFPDIAARAHAGKMLIVLEKALAQAKVDLDQIDAVAVTVGPGLIGSLLVGTAAAQTISYAWKKPIYAINHLEGHIYTALLGSKFQISNVKFSRLARANRGSMISQSESGQNNSTFYILNSTFPLLALIASGGHTQLVLMRDHLKYKIIGQTLDDAAGEAFDKVGRIMGLDYPGGPKIEALAKKGDPTAFNFPRPMLDDKNYSSQGRPALGWNFSFSGLKTAVIYQIFRLTDAISNKIWQDEYDLTTTQKADIAASFQAAVVDVLVKKTIRAALNFGPKTIVAGGGVIANQKLREKLADVCHKNGFDLSLPPPALTTDNAVGIALAGAHHLKFGKSVAWKKTEVVANLPLGRNKISNYSNF